MFARNSRVSGQTVFLRKNRFSRNYQELKDLTRGLKVLGIHSVRTIVRGLSSGYSAERSSTQRVARCRTCAYII